MTIYTDADLLAYIDGALPPDEAARMVAEMDHSVELKKRVRELTRFQAGLCARLFRVDCPDPHTLGEYHQGLLPASLTSQIRQHVAGCPHCAQELSQLEDFLAPGLIEKVRVIFATLLSGGPDTRLQFVPGLRGGQPGPLMYAAEERQIVLEFFPELRRPERRTLSGLVIGSPAVGSEVQLISDEQLAGITKVGEVGDFMFSELIPGTYALRVTIAGIEIRIPPFEIV